MSSRTSGALKIIGLLLFLWLLSRIDRVALAAQLRGIHTWLFAGSLAVLLLADAVKAFRWHLLLRAAGLPAGLVYAWETYNVGMFLGLITPAKVGELGRAAYVRKSGLSTGTALAVVFLDRVFDVAVIGLLSLLALGVLFGTRWLVVGFLASVLFLLALLWGALRSRRTSSDRRWLSFLLTLLSRPALLLELLLLTALSWGVYCAWSVLLAASIGLHAALLPFVSAIILAGVIALLPVAPSGLGTRDASLVWMLGPLGIVAPQAVALSFLMFVSIVVTSLIGMWYWIRGIKNEQQTGMHS